MKNDIINHINLNIKSIEVAIKEINKLKKKNKHVLSKKELKKCKQIKATLKESKKVLKNILAEEDFESYDPVIIERSIETAAILILEILTEIPFDKMLEVIKIFTGNS